MERRDISTNKTEPPPRGTVTEFPMPTRIFSARSPRQKSTCRAISCLFRESATITSASSTRTANAKNRDADQVSPRIGVSYFPSEWSLLFASYGSAFRAPTFNEMFATGIHFIAGPFVNRFVANPGLRPQSTETLEFGGGVDFKGVFSPEDQFKAKVSHFRIDAEDFIDTTVSNRVVPAAFGPPAFVGTTTITNVPKAELWGSEAEMTYANDRVDLVFGYSDVDGKNKATGAKLGQLTPPQFNVSAALKFPGVSSVVGWKFIAALQFDKVDNGQMHNTRRGYIVHDFYYSWRPDERVMRGSLKGLSVTLGVDNALDRAYNRVATGAFQPGRNFKGQVAYTHNF